ncbi:magnesium (Mg) transporter 10 isoform X2 [Carex rostrata]
MATSSSPSLSFLLFFDLSQSARHPKHLRWKPPVSISKGASFRVFQRILFPSVISRCKAKSVSDGNGGSDGTAVAEEDLGEVEEQGSDLSTEGIAPARAVRSMDSISLGIKEPVYEVIEVRSDGTMSSKNISRRQLLKSSGLRLRDIRSVDPSLWLMNSMPSLLIRDQAILMNLGTLRAIAMQERVFIFNYNSKGGRAFLKSLLPRLNSKNINGVPTMPFELEVVEAALVSRIQRLEQRLMDVEPRVVALLEVLPNRLTADVLEELRVSKQKLVELGSRAGDLKQMLLDLLEDPHEIRKICIMGRNCTLQRGSSHMECSLPSDKQVAEEEEEEIEMLLENYLQRCDSCHSQAERLLDSAREMEDSIAVNLSSRRLEVSKFELLLQVGTFCVAVGALVAVGILADDRWYNCWSSSRFLPNVYISQGKTNSAVIACEKCLYVPEIRQMLLIGLYVVVGGFGRM